MRWVQTGEAGEAGWHLNEIWSGNGYQWEPCHNSGHLLRSVAAFMSATVGKTKDGLFTVDGT